MWKQCVDLLPDMGPIARLGDTWVLSRKRWDHKLYATVITVRVFQQLARA